MVGRGVGDRGGGEVAVAASSPPSLSIACPCHPCALLYPPYYRWAYLYALRERAVPATSRVRDVVLREKK